jgi:hypothetical protein
LATTRAGIDGLGGPDVAADAENEATDGAELSTGGRDAVEDVGALQA